MSLLENIIVILIVVGAGIYALLFIIASLRYKIDDEPIFKTDIKITIKKQNDDESDKQT